MNYYDNNNYYCMIMSDRFESYFNEHFVKVFRTLVKHQEYKLAAEFVSEVILSIRPYVSDRYRILSEGEFNVESNRFDIKMHISPLDAAAEIQVKYAVGFELNPHDSTLRVYLIQTARAFLNMFDKHFD
jgi:hypothetical protein